MAAKRILIIDDEEPILEVIQGCLEDMRDWQILTATSGELGLQTAHAELPDGILLDVALPDMTGFEILQKLRSNPDTKTIPVILLTARVQPEDQTQLNDLKISGVILKPFDALFLAEQVTLTFGWTT